jgi:hypothetical protein
MTLSIFPAIALGASTLTSLSISSNSGTVGSTTSILGQNFAGTIGTVSWDGKVVVKNIPISDNGTLYYELTIPEGAKGTHSIKVADNSNWSLSSVEITYSVVPTISIFPDSIDLTSPFTVYGHGFNKAENDIQILVDGKPVTPIVPTVADTNGAWAATLYLVSPTKGIHTVSVSGSGVTDAALPNLSIVVAPFAIVKPLTGPVGTQLLFYGWGFRQNEDGITILWDNIMIATNIRAETNGNLIADGSKRESMFGGGADYTESIFVPPSYQGDHTIVIYGSSFSQRGTFPNYTFKVTPSVQIQPPSGETGVQIDVTCNGFAIDEVLTVKYDGTEIKSGLPIDKKGSMQMSFNAPKSIGKDHIISITGSKGNSLQAQFTTTDKPVVTENQTPVQNPPQTPSQTENKTPTPTQTKIEYIPPVILHPAGGSNFYLFNSVGDVFAGLFRYLGNIGRFFSGVQDSTTGSPQINFKWSDTNKIDSPEYILQISRDNQFSNVLLETNISSASEYNSPTNLSLPSGGYFWRIKTVDKQGNPSKWSDISTFHVNSMPEVVGLFTILISLLVIAAIIFAIITIRVNLANRKKY